MGIERTQRLNELVKRTLGTLIQRTYTIEKVGLITISRVVVSKDMQHARVFFTVLGGAEKEAATLKRLRDDQPQLRYALAHMIRLRYTPELLFEIDTELKRALHLDSLIDEAHDITAAHDTPPDDDTPS